MIKREGAAAAAAAASDVLSKERGSSILVIYVSLGERERARERMHYATRGSILLMGRRRRAFVRVAGERVREHLMEGWGFFFSFEDGKVISRLLCVSVLLCALRGRY